MNTLPASGSAPAWLRELATARTSYEELFGWPVAIEVEQQRLAAPVGGVLDAVTMPARLGEKVLVELQLRKMAGPVIAAADDAGWVFFTQPVGRGCRTVPAELHPLQVHLAPYGSYLAIPTQLDSASSPRWIKRPQPHHPLPPWPATIGAICNVAAELVSSEPRDLALAQPAPRSAIVASSFGNTELSWTELSWTA